MLSEEEWVEINEQQWKATFSFVSFHGERMAVRT